MIPIIDFCWHRFSPVQMPNVTVGALHAVALERSGQLFVFHDPAQRVSALIIAELVLRLVDEADLPHYERAVDVGLFDALRVRQLAIDRRQPAVAVTRLAEIAGSDTIIAINDDAFPVGLLLLDVLLERLPGTHLVMTSIPPLQASLAQQAAAGDLGGAIAALDAQMPRFHSEQANEHAPDPYICGGNGTPHKRSRCPCDIHPGANCGRRFVAAA